MVHQGRNRGDSRVERSRLLMGRGGHRSHRSARAQSGSELVFVPSENDEPFSSKPSGESHLVVVNMFTVAMLAWHDDWSVAGGACFHDRPRSAMADDEIGLAQGCCEIVDVHHLDCIDALGRLGRAVLDDGRHAWLRRRSNGPVHEPREWVVIGADSDEYCGHRSLPTISDFGHNACCSSHCVRNRSATG